MVLLDTNVVSELMKAFPAGPHPLDQRNARRDRIRLRDHPG
jgi:hypothetical protein